MQKASDLGIYLTDVWSTIALYLDDGDLTLTNINRDEDNVQYIDLRLNDAMLWKTPPRFAYVCDVRYTRNMLI